MIYIFVTLVHEEKIEIIPIPLNSERILQIHIKESGNAGLIENVRIFEINGHLHQQIVLPWWVRRSRAALLLPC
jgi:hypothetical protein